MHTVRTVYVIHHAHTDIGYTDLQERVIDSQVQYIRTALKLAETPGNEDFRWNCETWFCVERFLEQAAPREAETFFRLAREGRIGLSASYLNFNDLVDGAVLRERTAEAAALADRHGVTLETAMIADINGVSMGYRDALLAAGVRFLSTAINTHHGSFPLDAVQTAFWWENAAGDRLLVWNGEHYNLGNFLGLVPARPDDVPDPDGFAARLDEYLTRLEQTGYPYDFMPMPVSGVFIDNSPPSAEVLRQVRAYNARQTGVTLRMVSLQEWFAAVRDRLADAPVYHGDFTDWWAYGVGSTPQATKHYRAAQRAYRLCRRLDPACAEREPALTRQIQNDLLLYAEHTFGMFNTVSEPCDTLGTAADLRKAGMAAAAHAGAHRLLQQIRRSKGDALPYFVRQGRLLVVNPAERAGDRVVEFCLDCGVEALRVTDRDGRVLPTQIVPVQRGSRITFVDRFGPREEKTYTFAAEGAPTAPLTRQFVAGADGVADTVNPVDPVSCNLPYGFENRWFTLRWRVGEGVTACIDRATGRDWAAAAPTPLFTPVYERTQAAADPGRLRLLLGRNSRGQDAALSVGQLRQVRCLSRGAVYCETELIFDLPGALFCRVILRLYEALPRIDFRLEMGKDLSLDIESVYMPPTFDLPDAQVWVRKGGCEAFRPGMDQLPGTCMEYTVTDDGVAFVTPAHSLLIAAPDTPLLYRGALRAHPIRRCENRPQDNALPVWSWVMNSAWETNFPLDLAGFHQVRYSLWLSDVSDGEAAMDEVGETALAPQAMVLTD